MSAKGISLVGLLAFAMSSPILGETGNDMPPISYLNGTWAMGAGEPKYYAIVTTSWGKAKSLGESSFTIDLGLVAGGRKGPVDVPGNGGWWVVGVQDKGNLTAEVELESMGTGPNGPAHLTLIFHFIDRNKFWLESSFKGIDINTGPKKPWYRLSGPGDPPPPPSGPWPEM